MKVMLTRDVENVGRAGDVKDVADGYGRNFLLPRKLAVPARAGVEEEAKKIRDAAHRRETKDREEAQTLADDLAKRFPEDTVLQFSYLPTISAKLALGRGDSWKAIKVLQTAGPYELSFRNGLLPVYVRGEAYLAAHQGSEAATEFQKILDHRGIVTNDPIGALAHLQIGRAYAMAGNTAKAKSAYQDYVTLWKDADPDIPILKEAKAEYEKLQ